MKSAFRATGICPLDRTQALRRIPGGIVTPTRQKVYSQVSETFLQRLEEQRYGETGAPRRGKQLKVPPGKSWAGDAPPARGAGPTDSDEEAVEDPDGKITLGL